MGGAKKAAAGKGKNKPASKPDPVPAPDKKKERLAKAKKIGQGYHLMAAPHPQPRGCMGEARLTWRLIVMDAKSLYRRCFGKDDLAQELAALGLRLKKIAADGNCFFRALSDQLQGDESLHAQLRQQIMNHIQDREEDYAPFVEDDESFGTYVARMKKEGMWAGNMELVAASHTLRANLTIYQAGQPRWTIINFEQGSVPMLHLSYHDGQHYNSVRMADDPLTGPPVPIFIRGDGMVRKPAVTATDADWDEREVARVMQNTACDDEALVRWALKECRGDSEAAVEKVIERLAALPEPPSTPRPTTDPSQMLVASTATASVTSSPASVVAFVQGVQGTQQAAHGSEKPAQGHGQPCGSDGVLGDGCQGPGVKSGPCEPCVGGAHAEGLGAHDKVAAVQGGQDAASGGGLGRSEAAAEDPGDSEKGVEATTGKGGKRKMGSGVRLKGGKDKGPARNQPCPCGSKKKYKSCCGPAAEAAARRKAAAGGDAGAQTVPVDRLEQEVVGRAAQLAAITI